MSSYAVIQFIIIFFSENHLFPVTCVPLPMKLLLAENKKEEVNLCLYHLCGIRDSHRWISICNLCGNIITYYLLPETETKPLANEQLSCCQYHPSAGHCWGTHIYFPPGYFCHCFLCKEARKIYLISFFHMISKNSTTRPLERFLILFAMTKLQFLSY